MVEPEVVDILTDILTVLEEIRDALGHFDDAIQEEVNDAFSNG